jgi:hypothetical protein
MAGTFAWIALTAALAVAAAALAAPQSRRLLAALVEKRRYDLAPATWGDDA